MKKIITIVGARPQIIKAAALSRIIRNEYSNQLQEDILHTGQHYDERMSSIFFEEMNIPAPTYQLHVGSGFHGEQTAKMLQGIEAILLKEKYDGVVVYGDTNSTLAGALAAAKLQIPIFHVEAGLRSYNFAMPEEQNRILTDNLSTILFCPTQTSINNLRFEGWETSGIKKGEISLVGDVMFDNALYYSKIAQQRSTILKELKLQPEKYILFTIHRNLNTDNISRLTNCLNSLLSLAEKTTIVFPIHPRTQHIAEEKLSTIWTKLSQHKNIIIIPPASYFDIIQLEKNASVIVTDSGGVQKEAYFFERPCIILRNETEWIEIVRHHAAILTDDNEEQILKAYETLQNKNIHYAPLFGDGNATQKIVTQIISTLEQKK